jgi:hypothetical protein
VRREEVDHAVYGLRGVHGVHRAQDQVAGLHRRESYPGALGVLDPAYQDDVRALPEDALEGPRVRRRILPNLALVYDALLVEMEELYRVL